MSRPYAPAASEQSRRYREQIGNKANTTPWPLGDDQGGTSDC